MLKIITGVPGSGKSYFMVKEINNEINKKDNKFLNYYHNIAGLKIGIFEDFEKTIIRFKKLYEYFEKVKKQEDKENLLIEKSKELGIYKSYFFVDEAHVYFGKNRLDRDNYNVLTWFVSYHRHLYCNLFLGTQNLSLINSDFKAFSEVNIMAVSTVNKLFQKNLVYKYYSSARMSKKYEYRTETIRPNKEIFKLYQSGDKVKVVSSFRKILIITFILFLIMFFVGYFVYNFFKKKTVHKDLKNDVQVEKKIEKKSSDFEKKNEKKIIKKEFKEVENFNDIVVCYAKSIDPFCTTFNDHKILQSTFKSLVKKRKIIVDTIVNNYNILRIYIKNGKGYTKKEYEENYFDRQKEQEKRTMSELSFEAFR